MKHWRYFKYVMRHKWYVFLACCEYGLYWQGIVHDLSKFSSIEWSGYADWFFGGWRQDNYSGKSDAPPDLKEAYDYAWNHHQKANPHHWEYWLMNVRGEGLKALPMPKRYVLEMLADWKGAGMAINGKDDVVEWYTKQRDDIILHRTTRDYVESLLNLKI